METNQQQQQQQSSQTSPVAPPQSGSDPQPGYQAQAQAQPYQHLLQQQQQQLQMFWSYQRQEIEQANDFKNHQLPLARIKKIMKADEDVRMISAEAPILFAKACELFILELTIRSWLHAEENKRRTLQKNDIAAAITRTDIFDFLVDIVPREEIKEEGGGGGGVAPGMIMGGVSGVGVPYYYPPIGQPAVGVGVGVGVGGVMMGRPAMDHVGMYGQTATQGAWPSVWQNGGAAVVPGSVAGGGADDGVFGNGGGGGGNAGQANLDGQSDTHWT